MSGALERFEPGAPDIRQGAYVKTVAYLWQCYDDWCDCSQVKVERHYKHALCHGFMWPVTIALGEFHTDGERGPYQEMEEALALAAADQAAMLHA